MLCSLMATSLREKSWGEGLLKDVVRVTLPVETMYHAMATFQGETLSRLLADITGWGFARQQSKTVV